MFLERSECCATDTEVTTMKMESVRSSEAHYLPAYFTASKFRRRASLFLTAAIISNLTVRNSLF